MQPGSLYSNFAQSPFKCLPGVTAPSPFGSIATKLQIGQHRKKTYAPSIPPPLPGRNRLPNKASGPFLCLSVLSGHTPLVGCLVRFAFLRPMWMFPWRPHSIPFHSSTYIVSATRNARRDRRRRHQAVCFRMWRGSVAESSYKNNTLSKKLQGRAKRSAKGTGEWGESNGTCAPVIALKACIHQSTQRRHAPWQVPKLTTNPRQHGHPSTDPVHGHLCAYAYPAFTTFSSSDHRISSAHANIMN
jgi:hypothetical protein